MTVKLEYMGVQELVSYERNARMHSPEQINQIAASIAEFGFTNPVLVDENNILIAGHGRIMAAKQLGMDEIPVIRLSYLSDQQKKALRIADNQLALNASWDMDLLSKELAELESMEFNLELLGFEGDFLTELLEPDAMNEFLDQEEQHETPEPPVNPVTVHGDIWILDNHRLMCGDSTNFDHIGKLMEKDVADLLLTDPPYNVNYQGGTSEALTIMNDNMNDSDFQQFLRDVYSSADAFMKAGAVFYIWHSDSESIVFRAAAVEVGWKIRQCLIWNKNQLVLGRQDYQWKHEPCLYGWKEGAAHFWGSDRSQTTVLDFHKPQKNLDHPTMKPVALFQYQIQNSSKSSEIVLDLFGGSGTTAIACENSARKARLMELDPKYCDVIVKRWQNHTGKKAIHQSSGKTFDSMNIESEAAS